MLAGGAGTGELQWGAIGVPTAAAALEQEAAVDGGAASLGGKFRQPSDGGGGISAAAAAAAAAVGFGMEETSWLPKGLTRGLEAGWL